MELLTLGHTKCPDILQMRLKMEDYSVFDSTNL